MTKEEVLLIAKKFTNKTDFHNKARKYFDYAKANNFFDEATSHMQQPDKSMFKKDFVIDCIKTCSSVNEFRQKYPKLYTWVNNRRLNNELFSELKETGNYYKRCIYAYEFTDKSCYVGLTFNLVKRNIQHTTNISSPVFKHSQMFNVQIPKPKQLTDYVEINKAVELENFFYKKYKDDGWNMLNSAKTGAIGTCDNKTIYTKEYCKKLALNFKTRKDFELYNKYLYNKVLSHGWANYVFSHMNKELAKKIKGEKIRNAKLGKKMNIVDREKFKQSHSKHAVIQYDLNGNVINEFCSAYEAARQINGKATGIYCVCNGKTNTYMGFVWKYKENYNKKKYKTVKNNAGNSKNVSQYTIDGVFVKNFNSIKEAAKSVNKPGSTDKISKCCRGKLDSCFGFIWKYEK